MNNEIKEKKQKYNKVCEELKQLLTDVLTNGSMSTECSAKISQLRQEEQLLYNEIKSMNEEYNSGTNEEQKIDKELIVNLLTDFGRNTLLKMEEDGRVTIGGENIPQLNFLARIISLIATDGEDESQLQLTPEFMKLISDKIILDAKKIELNGSININDGLFKVSTTGRTQIGGMTGHIIDDYERSQLEINTQGTLYSVSRTTDNLYAKLSEGYIKFVNGSQTAKVTAAGIDTTSDIRLKENIKPIDGRYEKLMLDISPISFNMKDDRENIPKRRNIGFSAQQVKSLMDDYNISYDEFNGLNKDENDIYSLNYSQFIPLNTYLIQQQNKRIIELELRVLELENKKEG